MIKFNASKLGLGLVVALTLGLSGCYFYDQNPEPVDYSMDNNIPNSTSSNHHKAHSGQANQTAKTYSTAKSTAPKSASSTGPAQKTMPGPKRTAAPQIPVIQ